MPRERRPFGVPRTLCRLAICPLGSQGVRADETCAICTESGGRGWAALRPPGCDTCTHVFHRTCLAVWVKTRGVLVSCPVCRNGAVDGTTTPDNISRRADAIVDQLLRKMPGAAVRLARSVPQPPVS